MPSPAAEPSAEWEPSPADKEAEQAAEAAEETAAKEAEVTLTLP